MAVLFWANKPALIIRTIKTKVLTIKKPNIMKTTFHILLATLMVIFFVSCTDLDPMSDGSLYTTFPQGCLTTSLQHQGSDEYTANSLFPDGDAEQMIIYPQSGWTVSPGEIIMFKALLLDESTGKYVDITNNEKCHFNFSGGSGKCIDGNDPSLVNGQEITVSAVWNGPSTYSARSTGTFVDNREI